MNFCGLVTILNMTLQEYLSLHPKKRLIFDLDETLAMLITDWETMLKNIHTDLLKVDKEIMSTYIPSTMSYQLFNDLIRKYGPTVKKILESHYQKAEGEDMKEIMPNPELINFVKNNSNYNYYIWSNNLRATITKALEDAGIKDKFKAIVAADNNLFYKPDTTGIEKMIMGDKNNWLMIGDGENDQLGATALGIDFFLVDFFKK